MDIPDSINDFEVFTQPEDCLTDAVNRVPSARPLIAIPIGDPAGVGPEIVVKALAGRELDQIARCVVVGDLQVIQRAIAITQADLTIHTIERPEEGKYDRDLINLIDLNNITLDQFKMGEVSGICGRAAYEYIEKSIELASAGKVDAVSTTPINKESLRAGNVPFIGHTEIFAELTATENPLTMFEVAGMRVFFLSRHVSLRQACDLVTKEKIIATVKKCFQALQKLGVADGKMAIAGLNPHSGEHGLFGDEEVLHVIPAVEELQHMGYKVEGPIGADSVFNLALEGHYNSVLSLYHDQGHIATKTYDFYRTIAVTNGLPFLRTSVDHGTAFNLAGQGIASEVSMVEAIRLAARYAPAFSGKDDRQK
jgi:4-hydroxythreonine-4-phosphate dehydrogenase